MGLLEIFKIKELRDVTEPLLEAVVDGVTESEIAKDIPVIGTLYKAYDAAKKISAKFYIIKVQKFFAETADIPQEARETFVASLDEEGKEIALFEAIQLIIDRLNDERKASLIGKLFRAYVLGEIYQHDFMRYCFIVEAVYVDDFMCLKYHELYRLLPRTKESLYRAGVADRTSNETDGRVYMYSDATKINSNHSYSYQLTREGKEMVLICFNRDEL